MADVFFRIVILLIEIIILSAIIINSRKNKGPYYKGIAAGMLIYYAIIPLVLNVFFLAGSEELKNRILEKRGLNYIVNADIFTMMVNGILIIVLFGLFLKAYNSRITFSIGRLFSNRIVKRTVKNNFYSTLIIIGNVCLFIGGICTLYYILSFGSISRALLLSGYIRGFTVDSTKYISYIASLMIIPGGVVVASPWCFLLTIDYRGGIWKKIKFILSIILSILFLLVKAGRAPLLIFLVALAMPLLIKRVRHPWTIFLLAAIIGMPLIDWLDAVFDNSSLTSTGYNILSYLSQFAYPYRTSLSAFQIIEKYGLRGGQDFITTFVGMLPGFNFDSTWRIVSEYIGGESWKITGSTPTDLFTFCIMQFHVLGLFLGSVLGLICRNLDKSLFAYESTLGTNAYGINALESFILLNSFWFVSTADFESLVRNMYFFCISILIVITSKGLSNNDI